MQALVFSLPSLALRPSGLEIALFDVRCGALVLGVGIFDVRFGFSGVGVAGGWGKDSNIENPRPRIA